MKHNLVSIGMGYGLALTILHLILDWLHPEVVHDEAYHMDMARAYFAGKLRYWNGMITTPPGLYISSLLLYFPFSLIGMVWENAKVPLSALRMTSVAFAWLLTYFLSSMYLGRMIQAAESTA